MLSVVGFGLALLLALAFSWTRGPWWDEGVFSDVAVNFRNSAHLRSSLLAPLSYLNMPEPDRATYWQFPAYLVGLGMWLRVLPVSVFCVRLFSISWGCVFVASWFFFVKKLAGDETVALAVSVFVALDYTVIAAATDGRMDMMCAALGMAALAFFASWRESERTSLAAMTGVCGVLSLLSHPLGLVTNAVLLAIVLCDGRRLRGRFFLAALAPYLVFGGAWLLYIANDPALFVAQMKANSRYRVGGVSATLTSMARDFPERYLKFYFAPEGGWHRLKAVIPLFGLLGIVILAGNRAERRGALFGRLLVMLAVAYLGVAALDNQKFPYYLVYVMPVLAAFGGVWFARSPRMAALFAVAFVGANAANVAYYVHRNDFAREYRPAVTEIRKLHRPNAVIMGPSELGFAFGFKRPLIDDCYLGRVSGIQPQIYVLHSSCGPMLGTEQAWAWADEQLKEHYREVFRNAAYAVYERRDRD